MTAPQRAELWERLIAKGGLSDADAAKIDGRYDLRGARVSAPEGRGRREVGPHAVSELSGLTVVRGAHWKGIDFSDSRLPSLRFFDSIIEDCRFDRTTCDDWRLWNTKVVKTTFNDADLGGAALGGVEGDKRNAYVEVEFIGTDLRRTVHVSSTMSHCRFENAKLDKVDFQGTVFDGCTFEGPLNDVLFYRHAFRGEAFPPNEMRDVDLSKARLRYVEFRNLDMERVTWPQDPDCVVLEDYREALDHLIRFLQNRSEAGAKKAAASLAFKRKWAGPDQRRGILNLADLRDVGGPAVAADILHECRNRVVGVGSS